MRRFLRLIYSVENPLALSERDPERFEPDRSPSKRTLLEFVPGSWHCLIWFLPFIYYDSGPRRFTFSTVVILITVQLP
jgi:hypothetical protein